MEKTITLRLLSTGRIRIVEPDDGEPDSIIGFQSENNATNLKLILCSGVYSLKHYIEILAPDGTATSTQALTEDIAGSEHSVTLALSAEYIPEDGRYAVQYVGRSDDGTLVVKSSIIALDVGSSINAVQPGGPNNDWISWAEQEFADLDARITEAENDTVRATNNFETDAVILVADGTKKQAKSGGKTIAGLTAEIEAAAHADAVAEVNAEKARAQQAENDEALARASADTALGNRVTALENDRLSELEDKKGKLIVPDTDNSTSYVVELKVENGKLCLYYD